jgi:hypothetical protein
MLILGTGSVIGIEAERSWGPWAPSHFPLHFPNQRAGGGPAILASRRSTSWFIVREPK